MKKLSLQTHLSTILSKEEHLSAEDRLLQTKKHKKIVDLLTQCFLHNLRMFSLIGKNATNFQAKVRIVMNYTFGISKRLNGIFFSSNEKTVMLFYRKKEYKHHFIDYINYLKIILFCVPLTNLFTAFRREQKIKSLRAKEDDYLYVVFLGQEPGYTKLDGLLEAKNFLLKKAAEMKVPILVETTEKKLLIFYRRLGFDIYQSWEDPQTEMKIWFAKKEVEQPSKK